eukprot:jgi/Tetstr1/434630/TSEL_023721.t1
MALRAGGDAEKLSGDGGGVGEGPGAAGDDGDSTRPPAAALCAQCGQEAAKYRCPGCDVRTCSLDCVSGHKVDTGCTGKRDRTAFVPLREFDDRALGSDYVFLEEAMRLKDNAKRSRPPTPREELPHHLSTMVHQARRRSVELLLQSPGMGRRRGNTSRYDWKKRQMLWKVEWSFPTAGATAIDARVDERQVLTEVLAPHISLQPGQAARHHQLREYSAAGVAGLKVFLKRERCPANAPEYFALDLQATLANQLQGRTIIEHPVLIVVLPGEEAGYPLAQGEAAAASAAGHEPATDGETPQPAC